MLPIQMVDLKSQYHKIKPEIDKAIEDVLESSAFINGKPVQDFAAAFAHYIGVKHVITCGNGTDALQISLMALGLQPGDEVITPSFTFIATAEVIALLHLTPVFIDVDPKTFCMDPEAVKKAITPRTKAIVPVHLYGHAADMETILSIAEAHGIPVLEDNAQASGGAYTFSNGTTKKTGAMGQIAATSFFPSKNLGGYGDGGAIMTDDDELAHKCKMIAAHGADKRYYHEMVGVNSRLDTIQAAVLNIKLGHLDAYCTARRNAAEYYNKAFAGHPKITTPYQSPKVKHVYHQYTLILDDSIDRDGLKDFLASRNIPAMLYYPVPAHKQHMFSNYNVANLQLPHTDWLTQRVLSLPMHTELTEEQLKFITDSVLEYVNK